MSMNGGIESVRRAALVIAVVLALHAMAPAQETRQLGTYIPKLERNLKENIVPFWLTKSLDRKNGGYLIDFDAKGEPKLPGTKAIVTQSRQVWFFSHLARTGYGGRESLEAADLGFRFLKDKMWDTRYGGFYWEVDASGTRVLQPRKHLYGQAFALYGISEYFLASRNKEVLDFATQVFNLLDKMAHDSKYGGYREFFNEDWTPAPPDAVSYMGGSGQLKLMNTHLHLLEALTTFYRASKLPIVRERLLELIAIETNSVVRKGLAACSDKYDQDWTPRLEGDFARVSYGHDIENVWLVMDACAAAGIPDYPYLDLYKALWAYTLRYGYDAAEGGAYYTGAFGQASDDRDKVWWVQAEVIVSALYMYRITRDPKFIQVFEKTYDFIERRLTDWKSGEWHERITAEGKTQGDKASPWKAGYHSGRAMMECLALLKELTR